MIGAHQNLDGSHHLTTPLSGMFVILELGLATVNLLTKFEVSISISITHCSQIIANELAKATNQSESADFDHF